MKTTRILVSCSLFIALATPAWSAENEPSPKTTTAENTERPRAIETKTERKLKDLERTTEKGGEVKVERELRRKVRETGDRIPEPRESPELRF